MIRVYLKNDPGTVDWIDFNEDGAYLDETETMLYVKQKIFKKNITETRGIFRKKTITWPEYEYKDLFAVMKEHAVYVDMRKNMKVGQR